MKEYKLINSYADILTLHDLNDALFHISKLKVFYDSWQSIMNSETNFEDLQYDIKTTCFIDSNFLHNYQTLKKQH